MSGAHQSLQACLIDAMKKGFVITFGKWDRGMYPVYIRKERPRLRLRRGVGTFEEFEPAVYACEHHFHEQERDWYLVSIIEAAMKEIDQKLTIEGITWR